MFCVKPSRRGIAYGMSRSVRPITYNALAARPSPGPAIQSVIALRHFYCSSILFQCDFQLICLSGGCSPHLAATVSDVQHTDCELHHYQTKAYHRQRVSLVSKGRLNSRDKVEQQDQLVPNQ